MPARLPLRLILACALLCALPAAARTKKAKPTGRSSAAPAKTPAPAVAKSADPARKIPLANIDPDLRPDELAVWAAVLRSQFPDPVKTIAVVDRTATDSNRGHADLWKALRYLRIEIPDLDRSAADDFEQHNSGPHPLPSLTGTGTVKLVSWKAAPLTMEEWHKFHTLHPDADALVILSRIGLTTGSTQGLAYLEFACGDWCGGGRYLVLHPSADDKVWTVDATYQSWDFSEMWSAPPPADAPK